MEKEPNGRLRERSQWEEEEESEGRRVGVHAHPGAGEPLSTWTNTAGELAGPSRASGLTLGWSPAGRAPGARHLRFP